MFLLGPSHHHYLSKIALSKCAKYATPLGDIPIDMESKHSRRIIDQDFIFNAVP